MQFNNVSDDTYILVVKSKISHTLAPGSDIHIDMGDDIVHCVNTQCAEIVSVRALSREDGRCSLLAYLQEHNGDLKYRECDGSEQGLACSITGSANSTDQTGNYSADMAKSVIYLKNTSAAINGFVTGMTGPVNFTDLKYHE